MRIQRIAILCAAPLVLAGCAELGGLGGILDGGYGNSGTYGNNGSYGNNGAYGSQEDFEHAAVDACRQEASRYGQASIDNVQRGNNAIQVYGTVGDNRRGTRRFVCTYDSRGRITRFDI